MTALLFLIKDKRLKKEIYYKELAGMSTGLTQNEANQNILERQTMSMQEYHKPLPESSEV